MAVLRLGTTSETSPTGEFPQSGAQSSKGRRMEEQDPVRQIAAALGEREHGPVAQIRRLIERCGLEQVEAWLARTREIQAEGGMLTNNKQRRRTLGGVFFHLARGEIADAEVRNYVFQPPADAKRRKKKRSKKASPTAVAPGEAWSDRSGWIAEAEEGRATTVKVTVIGKAGKPVVREGFTLVRLTHTPKLDSLPKGLPVPAKAPETPYVLYIGAKQWRKVADSIKNPEDSLICEGVQAWDDQLKVLTVFVTNCTTKLLQQAQRPKPAPAQGSA